MGKLILENFLIGLTVGSYESLIDRVGSAVSKSDLFECEARVLATFKNHAVVINREGGVFRTKFDEDANFSDITKIDTSDYVVDETPEKITSSIVEDILNGNGSSTEISKLASILPIREDYSSDNFTKKVKSIFDDDRFWRKFVAENSKDVGLLVYDKKKNVGEILGSKKYEYLYTDKIPEEEFELHAESVTNDINEVIDRLSIVEQNIKTSLEIYEENEELFKDEEDLDSVDEFIDDILDDIDLVQEKISAVINEHGSCPACMGFIYDEFVENIGQYEIASEFIGRIINLTVENN
jgi:hypothetical protein